MLAVVVCEAVTDTRVLLLHLGQTCVNLEAPAWTRAISMKRERKKVNRWKMKPQQFTAEISSSFTGMQRWYPAFGWKRWRNANSFHRGSRTGLNDWRWWHETSSKLPKSPWINESNHCDTIEDVIDEFRQQDGRRHADEAMHLLSSVAWPHHDGMKRYTRCKSNRARIMIENQQKYPRADCRPR